MDVIVINGKETCNINYKLIVFSLLIVLYKCQLFLVHIVGEIHHKTVAKAFYRSHENELSGTKDNAVEYIVRKRTSTTYDHECHLGCATKGRLVEQ